MYLNLDQAHCLFGKPLARLEIVLMPQQTGPLQRHLEPMHAAFAQCRHITVVHPTSLVPHNHGHHVVLAMLTTQIHAEDAMQPPA